MFDIKGFGRKQSSGYSQSGGLRLSGRVWLWSEFVARWENCQQRQRERCRRQSIRNRSRIFINPASRNHHRYGGCPSFMMLVFYASVLVLLLLGGTHAFIVPRHVSTIRTRVEGTHYFDRSCSILREKENEEREEEEDDDVLYSTGRDGDDMVCDGKIIESQQDEPSTLADLSWRVEKLKLEEANTRRFLKSRPRFLPYEECRKWVIAFNRWDTEEDWRNWIDDGEKRNSYIPSRPDEYYGRTGKWKGWDHFLGKANSNCDSGPTEKENQNSKDDDVRENDDIGDFQ